MDRKKRILLVEDDSGSRKLMSIVLGRTGYEVIPAGNGVEALDTIGEAEPFDLVIMDLELPGLSGDKVILQIRDALSTRDVPVIVTTSCDRGSPLVQEALRAGATRILYKPTPMNVLAKEISRYLL